MREAARRAERSVVFAGVAMPTVVLDREAMPPGEIFAGPAIIEEDGASTVVPPGWRVHLEPHGLLVLHRS